MVWVCLAVTCGPVLAEEPVVVTLVDGRTLTRVDASGPKPLFTFGEGIDSSLMTVMQWGVAGDLIGGFAFIPVGEVLTYEYVIVSTTGKVLFHQRRPGSGHPTVQLGRDGSLAVAGDEGFLALPDGTVIELGDLLPMTPLASLRVPQRRRTRWRASWAVRSLGCSSAGDRSSTSSGPGQRSRGRPRRFHARSASASGCGAGPCVHRSRPTPFRAQRCWRRSRRWRADFVGLPRSLLVAQAGPEVGGGGHGPRAVGARPRTRIRRPARAPARPAATATRVRAGAARNSRSAAAPAERQRAGHAGGFFSFSCAIVARTQPFSGSFGQVFTARSDVFAPM